MSASLAIVNGTVLSDGAARRAHVYLAGDRVAAVTDELRPATQVLDATGCWVTPGLLDLHLNGAMGLDFTSGRLAELPAFECFLLGQGVTSYLAALNTAPLPQRLAALRAAGEHVAGEDTPDRPACLGYYLEGPYYAATHRGAHDAALMSDPSPAEAAEVLAAAGGRVRVWSLAPERAGALGFIRWLRQQGVVAAIGHSAATFEEVTAAADAGAGLVTHLYACLTSFSGSGPSKQLGGNEGALFDRRLTVELLADGRHLTPTLLRWALAVAGWRRCCVTTDAMAAAGLGDGVYDFLGSEIHVVDGVAYRPDRTHFAGSTANLPGCLANLCAAGLTPAAAVACCTSVPARRLGCWPTVGSLMPGARADVAVFAADWSPQATVRLGQAVVGRR